MYQILDALKDVLKERRLTYGQLALRLEVSLPTVKRWMNGQGTSLEDSLRIMDSVGLDLSELCDRAAHQRGEETFFTAEHEEVLAANPESFVLLFALREDQTPEDIERRHGLSRKATLRLLRLLENMDLIETRGIQVVRVRARARFGGMTVARSARLLPGHCSTPTPSAAPSHPRILNFT